MKILNLLKSACATFLQKLKNKRKERGNKNYHELPENNYFRSSGSSCGCSGGLWKN